MSVGGTHLKHQPIKFLHSFLPLSATTILGLSSTWTGIPKNRGIGFLSTIRTEKDLNILVLGSRPFKTHMLELECSLDNCIGKR